MKTIIEPFRIKMTESIQLNTKAEREILLEKAGYNVFLLDAEDCLIDLLTDSGTGAMSTKQWAAMMMGDESYSGSRSWKNFYSTVHDITGMEFIFPTHQGRAAEGILAETLLNQNHIVPNNSHFDTTRANIEFKGSEALNLLYDHAYDLESDHPFKGNLNIESLKKLLNGKEDSIPFVMITVTNNTGGGQPVSMENVRSVSEVCRKYKKPLVIDCCRFAENAYFIKENESGYSEKSLKEISQEMFSYADAATMSAKKDGLANIGGFLITNKKEWADKFRNLLILREGFPTYGGLAGRDLEAIAVGLEEALEYEYQKYRHATMTYLSNELDKRSIPYVKPVGGHAVFLDAKSIMPHIPALNFPGISLVNELYTVGGIRTVELGSVMFGKKDENGNEIPSPLELVRLAIPRRVYTQSHFDYLIEVIDEVWKNKDQAVGYKLTYQAPFLRHFTARFEKLNG